MASGDALFPAAPDWSANGSFITGPRRQRRSAISVIKGDTLDFVVDCRASDSFDSFSWAPTVIRTGAEPKTWSSEAQFAPPMTVTAAKPLTKWERYVQALLMTNDFYFID